MYECTLRPTIMTLPSAAHAIVKPSPPSCTVAVQVLLLTSQNLHVPSLLTDANSASFVGFQATRSIPPVCPLNSVLFFTCGFSGFHIRSVRSAEPVAIRWPVGFQAMVRMLEGRQESGGFVGGKNGGHTYVWEPGPRAAGSWYVWTLRVGKRAAKRSLAIGLRGWGGAIVRAKRKDGGMPRI